MMGMTKYYRMSTASTNQERPDGQGLSAGSYDGVGEEEYYSYCSNVESGLKFGSRS